MNGEFGKRLRESALELLGEVVRNNDCEVEPVDCAGVEGSDVDTTSK